MNVGELAVKLGFDGKEFDRGLDQAEGKMRGFGSKLAAGAKAAGAAAGVAAGAGLATGMASALEFSAAQSKLEAQLGNTGAYSQEMGAIAGRLYADAYGGSMGEVSNAVRMVVQSGALMEDATNDQIQSITAKTLSLAQAFDQDVQGSITAVAQMVRTGLAPDAETALDILTRGFQQGLDRSGDLLDNMEEYGTQFRKLGLDGQTAFGLISQGMRAGARDSDVVADAIKEFSLLATNGSKSTAEGFAAIGLNAHDMASKIAAGGPTATAAFGQVLDSLRAIEDPLLRNEAAIALFGTKAEDLGEALFALDPSTAVMALGDVAGAAEQMDAALRDNAQVRITDVSRDLETLGAELVALPGPFGTAAAGVAVLGPAALGVLAPLGTMVAAQRAAAAATVAAGGVKKASWISTAAVATASALRAGAAWLLTAGVSAASAVAATTAAAVRIVAQWTLLAVTATASAVRAGAAWLLTAGAAAASAVAGAAVAAASIVAQWVVMAAGAMARAAVMAAAWLVAMGPVGWVIAAVVGLVALIIANWDTVKAWTVTAWNAVSAAVGAAWEWIKSAVAAAAQFVVDLFMNWTLPGLIIQHWDTIKDAIGAAWDWILSTVSNAASTVTSWLSNAWQTATSLARDGWSNITNAVSTGVSTILGFITSLPGRILSALGNLGSLLLNSGRALVDGFLRGIQNAWNSLVGWVQQGMSYLRGLWPFSPAQHGPFAGRGYVTYSGAALTGDFADSLRAGVPGIIAAAREAMDAAQVSLAPELDRGPSSLPGDGWLSRADSAPEQRRPDGATVSVTINNPLPETSSDSINRRARSLAILGSD